jgi:hypothetical protein
VGRDFSFVPGHHRQGLIFGTREIVCLRVQNSAVQPDPFIRNPFHGIYDIVGELPPFGPLQGIRRVGSNYTSTAFNPTYHRQMDADMDHSDWNSVKRIGISLTSQNPYRHIRRSNQNATQFRASLYICQRVFEVFQTYDVDRANTTSLVSEEDRADACISNLQLD